MREIIYYNFHSAIIPKKFPRYAENPVLYGSSLNRQFNEKRKPKTTQYTQLNTKTDTNNVLNELAAPKAKKTREFHTLSLRSKVKIKNKLAAWFYTVGPKNFTFVTLTFIDKVEDRLAVKILNNYLTNIRKSLTNKQRLNFNYLWVAEKQGNGNIHFHIANTHFWNIKEANENWIRYQLKSGLNNKNLKLVEKFDENNKPLINPNNGLNLWYNLNPFDVEKIKSTQSLGAYMTKYITKNETKLTCAVWHCSKAISKLFTGYLGNRETLRAIYRAPSVTSYYNPRTGVYKTYGFNESEYSITQKIVSINPIYHHYQKIKENNIYILKNHKINYEYVQTLDKYLFNVNEHIEFCSTIYLNYLSNKPLSKPSLEGSKGGEESDLLNAANWGQISTQNSEDISHLLNEFNLQKNVINYYGS